MPTALDPSRGGARRREALTGLVLDAFRFDGGLLAAGDAPVADLGFDERALAGAGRRRALVRAAARGACGARRVRADRLSSGLRPEAIEAAAGVLRGLQRRLDAPAAGRTGATTDERGA